MNSAGNQRELIRQIKEAREHCGISYQKIVDRVLESGGSISLSSVRKVFREDAEELHFRTEDTLLPIARVLLPPGSLSGERENAPCQSERVPDEGIQSEYARERQKEEEREERRQAARIQHMMSLFLGLGILLFLLSVSLHLFDLDICPDRTAEGSAVCQLLESEMRSNTRATRL